MDELANALTLLRSSTITKVQTLVIDKVLSTAKCDDIPSADALNVMDYIDSQLLHNVVDSETTQQLERLYDELRLRRDRAE